MVDENEVEGTVRDIGGKVQDAVGGLTGDTATQMKGKLNQAAGQVQKTFGAAAEELRENVTQQPLTALALAARKKPTTFITVGIGTTKLSSTAMIRHGTPALLPQFSKARRAASSLLS